MKELDLIFSNYKMTKINRKNCIEMNYLLSLPTYVLQDFFLSNNPSVSQYYQLDNLNIAKDIKNKLKPII